ncbi:YcaO-like family protein [Streptomyces sp. NPDC088789]|uniref:YcaO-like family protein n=1 Tax=Streptomyces sp. NPDC088789 TaxID=3365899 RepID=UPI003800D265
MATNVTASHDAPLIHALDEDPAPDFGHGTRRLIPPEQTLERLRALLPILGITRIANVTGLDHVGIPVAMACRPLSRSLSVSQGKGLDLLAAKVSAAMESLEAYHAERVDAPMVLSSWRDLRRTVPVTDPDLLPQPVDGGFRPDLVTWWIRGYDILGHQPLWLPYELIHTDFTVPAPAGAGCFQRGSNGLASGNHLLEAISHGICEVVERDALTLWPERTPEDHQARRIDPTTVYDLTCRQLLKAYDDAAVNVALWDMTSDLGIPAFLCLISDRDRDEWRRLYPSAGSGCHPHREIALARALTEAAQTRLTFISGAREDVRHSHYRRLRDTTDVDVHWSKPRCHGRVFSAVTTHQTRTLREDVRCQLDQLRHHGAEHVVVVNLTRSEIDMPVVRVVIPGLEGLGSQPGYRPGPRLTALIGRQETRT